MTEHLANDEVIFELLERRTFEIPAAMRSLQLRQNAMPAFSIADPNRPFENIFYAFLKTNENLRTVQQDVPPKSLDGCFVGIGFGASLQILLDLYQPKFAPSFLCEREPYVYILGKILLLLCRTSPSAREALLSIIDYHSFSTVFARVVEYEPDDSPLFYRRSRDELLNEIPLEVNYLRQTIFNTTKFPLSEDERNLFDTTNKQSLDFILR